MPRHRRLAAFAATIGPAGKRTPTNANASTGTSTSGSTAANAPGMPHTIADAVRDAARYLQARRVPEARASAEWLATAAFAEATTRAAVRLAHTTARPPPTDELARFRALVARRARRAPVQYLVGEWGFHNIELRVRAPVLVPRPETEGLVDAALAHLDRFAAAPAATAGAPAGGVAAEQSPTSLPQSLYAHSTEPTVVAASATTNATSTATAATTSSSATSGSIPPQSPLRLLDVGCGSGAVFAAVLAARPDVRGVGIDIAPEAVALSRENLSLLGLSARGVVRRARVADLVDGSSATNETPAERATELHHHQKKQQQQQETMEEEETCEEMLFDVLVSNPPYVCDDEMPHLPPEVADFEDERALRGGSDGLDVVREIIAHAPRLVRRGGAVVMEVGERHPSVLATVEFEGLQFERGWDDVYGRPRFVQWRVM